MIGEVLLFYILGIITAIYMLLGNDILSKFARISLKVIAIMYPIAVFIDPLLALPNTPKTLPESFMVNSFVVSAFFSAYFLNYFLIKKLVLKDGDKK